MDDDIDDEDLPSASAYPRYSWDCPECGENNDEGDIEPSGVVECESCGERVFIR